MALRRLTKADRIAFEKEAMKEAYKEAMKEWLDDKYTHIGKWTVKSVVASGFAALLYFILWSQGWHRL